MGPDAAIAGARRPLHMQQRIGIALPVQSRPPHHLETLPLIKSQSLRILFVHIQCQPGMQSPHMLQKRPAHTVAEAARLNKKHLHLSAVAANKARQRAARSVLREGSLSARGKLRHP